MFISAEISIKMQSVFKTMCTIQVLYNPSGSILLIILKNVEEIIVELIMFQIMSCQDATSFQDTAVEHGDALSAASFNQVLSITTKDAAVSSLIRYSTFFKHLPAIQQLTQGKTKRTHWRFFTSQP